jgi:hypothetical protein
LEKDEEIKSRGQVLNVEEVVAKFFLGILNRAPILKANLSPAGDPRPDGMSQIIVGNFAAEPFDKFRPLRAGPYEAHIAPQYVPELGNLVKPGGSKESSYGCNSGIIITRPSRTTISFCVCLHRSELIAFKEVLVAADTFLLIKDRPL